MSKASLGYECAQHSVHPTGGSLRVFKQVAWLEVDSVKMALSRPPPAGNASRWAVPCITLIMPKGITKDILVSTV